MKFSTKGRYALRLMVELAGHDPNDNVPLKEIGDVLNCPLSTVKTRLYTGLKKLRVSLEGEEAV